MATSNFEFLKGVNDFLFSIARAAEKNYPDDPNTTLFKVRVFGESTAKHLAKILDIETPDNQHDLLRELAKVPFVDDNILKVFHQLRQIGNQAVHEYHNDLEDAAMCLRLAFRIAVWYYRLVTKDYEFAVPVFVLPSSENSDKFEQEIRSLKAQLASAYQVETQTKAEVAAQNAKLIALTGYISILESNKDETQEQTQQRIDALEAQLKEKDAELAKKTEVERKAYKKQMLDQAASRTLDLSESETRYLIDRQLCKAGWDADSENLKFSKGTRPQIGRNMAIAEWPTGKDETGKLGYADYVLFVGLKPIGVIEAKKANKDVAAKLSEAYRYSQCFDHDFLRSELQDAANDPQSLDLIAESLPAYVPTWSDSSSSTPYKIPFCYSANGRDYRAAVKTKSGIWCRDVRHATNMAKALPEWHRPEELIAKLESDNQLNNRWFSDNADMSDLGLRYYQEEAVQAVEKAIVSGQQDILLAMATGTGKTRTAIALMYRLIQSQRFKRILFLVDRTSLGKQALDSFEDTNIKGDTFNSIFNVKGLTDRFPEDSTKIHVATVQSLVKRTLQSDEVMPVGRYDCIIVDEAHRGYILDKEQTEGEEKFRNELDFISSYRRIIDHFDAVKVALTATPALHTIDIFGGEKKQPVYRYSYRKAVIDGYLTDQEPPIRIVTQLSEGGVYLSQGTEVQRLSNQGELVNDTLDDEQGFEVADFNRALIASNFNKVVCEELANNKDFAIDPTSPQKTLVFCVNNTHADMVVEELRTAFKAKYPQLEHDAIIKITGDSDKDATKVQSMITRFKKERLPNIVVTVDLLTTGIDIPSICNLVFMRKVRSRILYEQMKGRATRLCPEVGKTSFRIFDAVDLYSTLQSVDTMRPVVVRPSVDLQTLVNEITDSETYKTIEADGRSFAEHSHEQLVAKLQRIIGHAQFNRDKSKDIEAHIKRFDEICTETAGCNFLGLAKKLKEKGPKWSAEVFNNATNLISRLEQLKTEINALRDMPIFTDLPDAVTGVSQVWGDHDSAEDFLEAFDKLVDVSVNQQEALDIIINRPRDLTRKGLIELQEWFDAQNYNDSTLRHAWNVAKNQDIAAKLIGHIRRASIGDALMPFEQRVDLALERIKTANDWNDEQLSWLERLASSIKEKVVLDDDTFKTGNYKRKGGKRKLMNVFNDELDTILAEFNEYMWDERA
ncbi:TPA: type I restriction-modification system endonuclease [Vibrio parahaemolyticus]|uniref:type I restriction-modification system endonuclease n=1 Tax=Vibrio parahaemolyticus TaxID=670 RepID=UPI001A197895|nr:type I restriction-modification system endonuclease [Vibrio parahaemolyticus]EHW0642651.1 type I restriction-modification system endonuclease [Vibrio parahaemolyticus]EHZ2741617.1 type I restriction-modification system endonuclease [Vibrio parahaemolyticus]MDG2992734.1 type I restriction-modification system endonuclease [Vibrio parahaemolyticus]HAS6973984.1 type I restriction-modification system endonuclease [Vibrio parahaemolyticus]